MAINSNTSFVSPNKPRPGRNPTGASVFTDPGSGLQSGQAGEVPGFPEIAAPSIPYILVPVVDPINRTQQVGDFNTVQFQKALGYGKDNALALTQLDFDTLSMFNRQARSLAGEATTADNVANRREISAANAYNLPEVGRANRANQAQRLQQLDFALPGAREAIQSGINRGRVMSEGRFVATAEDRAFEVASRNAAADGTIARGFGDDSVFGRRTSDQLSAEQRLQLSQVGDATTSRFLQLGANLAFDQPIKYNPVLQQPFTNKTSQDIPGKPSVSGPEIATQQQGQISQLSTIMPGQAITFDIGQNQFQAGMDREADKVNASFEFGASQFNSTGTFQSAIEQFYADTFNAQQQASATNAGIQSEQAQANFESAQTTGIISGVTGAAVSALTGYISGGGTFGGLLKTGASAAPGTPQVVSGTALTTGPASQIAAAGAEGAAVGAPAASGAAGSAGTAVISGTSPGGGLSTTTGATAAYSSLAVPVGIAAVAASSGRGVYETVQGLTDGSITKQDAKTALANTLGPANFATQGVNEMFGRPLNRNDVNNAMLLSNPVTAPLALADMAFGALGGSGKSKQQQQRDALREHAVDTGMFFHPSDEQVQTLGMEKDSQYVRNAKGAFYNIGRDGGAKIKNYGTNVDGKNERHTYDVDWSDPRAAESVGMLNPVALIAFGDNYQKMMGNMWNAAASDTNSLSGMKANAKQYVKDANIDYRTGVQVLSSYKDRMSSEEYSAFMNGWNELMLTDGVSNDIVV